MSWMGRTKSSFLPMFSGVQGIINFKYFNSRKDTKLLVLIWAQPSIISWESVSHVNSKSNIRKEDCNILKNSTNSLILPSNIPVPSSMNRFHNFTLDSYILLRWALFFKDSNKIKVNRILAKGTECFTPVTKP